MANGQSDVIETDKHGVYKYDDKNLFELNRVQ